MRKIAVFLLCCMFMCMYANAPFTAADEPLLNAYLENNMPAWRAYIHATDWAQATQDERQRILAYEYGYCAAMMETDKAEAQKATQLFHSHVQAMEGLLPKGYYEMYLSAIYAFEFKLGQSFHVFSILRYANKALELAPNDPIIVGYMGNVLFYAPKGIGDKKKALALFEKAATLFESSKWEYCWNRPAMLLAAAQCYEKTGRKNEALSIANDLLNEFPNFTYIRDTYLPALRNAK